MHMGILDRFGNGLMVLAAAVLLAACSHSSDEIKIRFDVDDAGEGSAVLVYNGNIREVTIDSLGKGEISIAGIDAVYANVFYGMTAKKIFAERGDDVLISFSGKDFMGTFKFDGDKAPAVDYLNRIELTALPDEDYALSFEEYEAKLDKKMEAALRLLSDTDLKGTGSFRKIEEGRTEYAYHCALMMFPVGHQLMAQDAEYEAPDAYYETIRKYAVENDILVDIQEYRDFMAEAAYILSGVETEGLYNKLVAEMNYISEHYESPKFKEVMFHHIAAPYIENMGTDGTKEMENIYRTYVKNPVLLADFQEKYDKWDLTIPGKRSPDFSAPDIGGKKWSLRDFRGKYVYIDVWATWCGPCRQELPYMKELESEFEGKDIVFLGLSIDKDKAAWEAKVKSGELCGVQLYLGTGSSFQNRFRINGIPRFILIDREGRVLNAEMSRPSAEETAGILRDLEGI